jgi:hypothetical protein
MKNTGIQKFPSGLRIPEIDHQKNRQQNKKISKSDTLLSVNNFLVEVCHFYKGKDENSKQRQISV